MTQYVGLDVSRGKCKHDSRKPRDVAKLILILKEELKDVPNGKQAHAVRFMEGRDQQLPYLFLPVRC
jgi:hypothetical protein